MMAREALWNLFRIAIGIDVRSATSERVPDPRGPPSFVAGPPPKTWPDTRGPPPKGWSIGSSFRPATASASARVYDGSTGTFEGLKGAAEKEAIAATIVKAWADRAGMIWNDETDVDGNLTSWFLDMDERAPR